MKKTIYSKYDKQRIGQLPKVIFEGRVIVIQNDSDCEKAVQYLLGQPLIGLDTETRPSFKKGKGHLVSLLQLSTPDTCFLFRLNRIGIKDPIRNLLESNDTVKVGLSLNDDVLSLHRRADFKPGAFIDLQKHIGELGIEDLSLQKIYANLFGEKISKGQRLTNWDADVLTEAQKRYAATDAWACIMIYNEYLRLKATGDYELIVVEPEITENESINDKNNV